MVVLFLQQFLKALRLSKITKQYKSIPAPSKAIIKYKMIIVEPSSMTSSPSVIVAMVGVRELISTGSIKDSLHMMSI